MHSLPNLPASVAHEVFAQFCKTLPPPVIDTPEARAARDDTAMAAVAALYPADAFEAYLAAQIVEAAAHARDCLGFAVQPGQRTEAVLRYRAQASAMMRHTQGGMRALERRQAAREKAEAAMHLAAMERAGWWFQDASVPLPEPAPAQAEVPQSEPPRPEPPRPGPPQSEAPRPEPPQPGPPQPAAPQPVAAPPVPDRYATDRAEPPFTDRTEAEQYAAIYPDRAALIRAHGGLPARLDFGAPEPELVDALVRGTSPLLRALDRGPRAAATA